MNLEGYFRNLEYTLPEKLPFLTWSSIRSLFAEINAISIPEKKAEASKVTKIIR